MKMITLLIMCEYNINNKLSCHQPITKETPPPKYGPLKEPERDTISIFQCTI